MTCRILLLACLLSAACKKSPDIAKNTPSCIRETISSRGSDEDWEIGSVDEYRFQGQLVYAFNPDSRIADGTTIIKDEACATICQVGGFGGPDITLCNGANFYNTATFIRNIWTD